MQTQDTIIGFMQHFWLLYVLIAVISANLVQVIQNDANFSKDFLEEMNAEAIGQTLEALDLIPPQVATDIERARSKKEANNCLLKCMKKNANEKTIREILTIASKEKGFGRMNDFAGRILGNQQWGLYL